MTVRIPARSARADSLPASKHPHADTDHHPTDLDPHPPEPRPAPPTEVEQARAAVEALRRRVAERKDGATALAVTEYKLAKALDAEHETNGGEAEAAPSDTATTQGRGLGRSGALHFPDRAAGS